VRHQRIRHQPAHISATNLFQASLQLRLPAPGLAGALGYQATSPQSSACHARRTSSASIRVFRILRSSTRAICRCHWISADSTAVRLSTGKNFVTPMRSKPTSPSNATWRWLFSEPGLQLNGGRHLNRRSRQPGARRLVTANWQAAVAAGAAQLSTDRFVAGCGVNPIPGSPLPYYVPSALVSFFVLRLNPSLAGGPSLHVFLWRWPIYRPQGSTPRATPARPG